jgi:hypothetical protein
MLKGTLLRYPRLLEETVGVIVKVPKNPHQVR